MALVLLEQMRKYVIYEELTGSVRCWQVSLKFRSYSRSQLGWSAISLASNSKVIARDFNAPPGAVGGQYGSGCFHVSSSFSVSFSNAYIPISRQVSSGRLDPCSTCHYDDVLPA